MKLTYKEQMEIQTLLNSKRIDNSSVALSNEEMIKSIRNYRLKESDWTQLPDAPVDREAWAIYRQALRDITKQTNYPYNIVWPQPPQ